MSAGREEWSDTRFPGYRVSSLGNVTGPRGGVLRPGPVGKGYLQVSCRGNSQRVHRLVAEAFLGPEPEGCEVAHINGDPADNRAANLAYKTHAQNEADKVKHGTGARTGAPGESNAKAKLTADDVRAIRASTENKSQLARRHGVTRWTITHIIRRQTWRHIA